MQVGPVLYQRVLQGCGHEVGNTPCMGGRLPQTSTDKITAIEKALRARSPELNLISTHACRSVALALLSTPSDAADGLGSVPLLFESPAL